MNGIRNTLAAALVLALAAPAAAGAQTALGDRDDALSGHPAEERRDLPGSDSPLSTDEPGTADTSDRGIVPELNPLRDFDEPISPSIGEGNAPGPSILDPEDGGGSILPD
jgi:hypothetical protein